MCSLNFCNKISNIGSLYCIDHLYWSDYDPDDDSELRNEKEKSICSHISKYNDEIANNQTPKKRRILLVNKLYRYLFNKKNFFESNDNFKKITISKAKILISENHSKALNVVLQRYIDSIE